MLKEGHELSALTLWGQALRKSELEQINSLCDNPAFHVLFRKGKPSMQACLQTTGGVESDFQKDFYYLGIVAPSRKVTLR